MRNLYALSRSHIINDYSNAVAIKLKHREEACMTILYNSFIIVINIFCQDPESCDHCLSWPFYYLIKAGYQYLKDIIKFGQRINLITWHVSSHQMSKVHGLYFISNCYMTSHLIIVITKYSHCTMTLLTSFSCRFLFLPWFIISG